VKTALFQTELANKIQGGRAVGNLHVVTQRPIGRTGILASFDSPEEAREFILAAECSDYQTTGLIFPSLRGDNDD
jgi:hypothetical protein